MARNGASIRPTLESARLSAEVEPGSKKIGRANSIAGSVRSYVQDDDDEKSRSARDPAARAGAESDLSAKKIGRANSIAGTPELEFAPRKFGRANSVAGSIRSYVNDGDDEVILSPRDLAARPSADVEPVPIKFGRANSNASSIRSYLTDDDEKEGSQPQMNPRVAGDISDSDPYAAVRVSRQKSGLGSTSPYASLTVAGSPRLRSNSFGITRKSPVYDPYMQVKVTASPGTFQNGHEVIYDSNESSASGESGDDSVHGDEDRWGTERGSGSQEEDDNELSKRYAKLSVAGNAREHARDGNRGYARVTVVGRDASLENDAVEGMDFGGSDAGSDLDGHGEDDEDALEYARISVAGSEVGHRQKLHTGGLVSDGESDQGHLYAKLSVAGSDAEYDNDTSNYRRYPVRGKNDQGVSGQDDAVALSNKGPGRGDASTGEQAHILEVWNKEFETFNNLPLVTQAKLQYRVRVILTSPLFEVKQRKVSAFSDVYERKFGSGLESAGFSSALSLCLAMPGVVQREALDSNGVLLLEDSIQNQRAVSGIRSGLRRIVYDALNSLPSRCPCSEFEEKCSELLGVPLMRVLSDHGYDSPSVKSLVQDMLDIIGFQEGELGPVVYLCEGPEDPALTDGLLIKSASVAAKELGFPQKRDTDENGDSLKGTPTERESLKVGSFLTLRSLRNELRRYGNFGMPLVPSSLCDEVLHLRLQLRILLAFYNLGRGIQLGELPELYQKIFGKKLDVEGLGFESLMELATFWQDIFLLQGPKPGWVFLIPSQANRRILNTLRMGLRASVFSVLVEIYPDGLDPLEFLHRLQQATSGELWDILEAAGYICSDVEKADSILSSSSSSDFQLVDFEEICVLLDDMIDFVRFGSNEDGSPVVKLRNGEVPLVDIMECKLEDTDVASVDELFVNLLMIAVDVSGSSDADSLSEANEGVVSVGHVQSLVRSFEGAAGLRSAHSQAADSLKLKHELRFILGCPQYFDCGLAWNELSTVYKDRTGYDLGPRSKVKSLVRGMPDIICKDSLMSDRAILSKTPKNLRILSTTKSGLRQVLFWALVKNPGGVWANFLEGWYTDFSGMSLAATLQVHGYEASRSRPFFPVFVFLRDMADLLQKKPVLPEVYVWTAGVEDPIHSDANLLGMSELAIQYDPLKGYSEIGLGRTMGLDMDAIGRLQDESIREELAHKIRGTSVSQQSESMEESSPLSSTEGLGGSREEELLIPKDIVDGSGSQIDNRDESGVNFLDKVDPTERDGSARMESVRNETSGGVFQREEDMSVVAAVNESMEGNPSQTEDESSGIESVMHGPAAEFSTLEADREREQAVENSEGNVRTSHSEADFGRQAAVNGIADANQSHAHQRNSTYEETRSPEGESTGLEERYPPLATEEDSDSEESDLGNDASLLKRKKLSATIGPAPDSLAESYAQLRVASKGAKVNLGEWQFTDSEDEDEEEEDDEAEVGDDEQYSDGDDDEEMEEDEGGQDDKIDVRGDEHSAEHVPSQTETPPSVSREVASEPKGKVIEKKTSVGWIFPNKGIPWR